MQRLCVIGVVIVAALTGAGRPYAQGAPSTQRVWTGTWEEQDSWEGSAGFGRSQAQISFVYVQGRDEFGLPRWESRRLTWSAVWEDSSFDRVWVEQYGEADERGIYSNRSRMDIVTVCSGGGTLELGPAVWAGERLLTPEQKAQLRPSCVTTYRQREAGPTPPPTPSQRDALKAPSVPNEDELTGCAYEKTWPIGTRGAGSLSVSVSAPVTAVMEVDPTGEYGRFVPVPGEPLIFTASVPSGTARFRFELDPEATSRFPGYATNANVDDMFFVKYNLGYLRGSYANDGPDMIFDPERFSAVEWSRREPAVVETRIAQGGAVVTVTAMDYGAVGKLRAFVKSEGCGDWQPVPIRVGAETREAVAIPMDDDNNLMADALEIYRGRDSGADDDAEPRGNGMAGDGLTAFEEYRGFLIRGADCPVWSPPPAPQYPDMPLPEPMPDAEAPPPPPPEFPQWNDEHIRTTPRAKNLFVHTLDPELGLMVDEFAWASDLSVHLICEPHYVNNDTRIVNFTLQQSGLRNWGGKRISQDEPQHGIHVLPVRYPPGGAAGIAVPVDPAAGVTGPPKLHLGVLIYKPPRGNRALELIAARLSGQALPVSDPTRVLIHELLHTVGVPHHGDRVENWRFVVGKGNVTPQWSLFQRGGGSPPAAMTDEELRAIEEAGLNGLLILPGTDCDNENRLYRDGRFAGCGAMRIARRGQQNSGDFECPMRYFDADRYEAPGSTAVYRWTGIVTGSEAGAEALKVDAWEGNLLKYSNDLDRDPRGKLCSSTKGTVINALPRDRNHAGDAGREKACREYLVVNDLAARGVR